MDRTTSSQGQTAASDQALINTSPASFSGLVKEAGQMPEVRSDLVSAYKSQVQSGHYPSREVEAGLIDLIGGGIAKMAQNMASSQSAQKN